MRCFPRVEQHTVHQPTLIMVSRSAARPVGVERLSLVTPPSTCAHSSHTLQHIRTCLSRAPAYAPMPFMSVSQGKGVIQRHAATARACTPRCLTTLDRTTRSKYIHHHCATHETLLKTRTMAHCLYVRKLHFVPYTRFQSRSAHTTHAFSASVPVTKDLPAHLTVARAPLIG